MVLGAPLPQGAGVKTLFAPGERASRSELEGVAKACLDHPVARFFIEAAGGMVLILDSHRQVLAVNAQVQAALGEAAAGVLGRRPGELFGCIHADDAPSGCGTSAACAHCGAVLAVLECQRSGNRVEGECQLTLKSGGRWVAAEFRIVASPLDVGSHRFIAVVLQDLSASKRKEALERLFFHDVANLMQGIRGWTELIAEGGVSSQVAAGKLVHLTNLLDRELRSHQDMARAESGHLRPDRQPLRPSAVLTDVQDLLDRHPSARDRHLRVQVDDDPLLTTDPDLLTRVVLNMAVNAVEATAPGAEVLLRAGRHGDDVRLEVCNPGEIPREFRSRIFQRSFSTKGGTGRGLGTYAMKLFGENVLGGRVGFECGEGWTRFFIDLPQHMA